MQRIPGWLSLVATAVVVGGAFVVVGLIERDSAAQSKPMQACEPPVPDESPAVALEPVHVAAASERLVAPATHSVDDYLTELADPSTRFASGRLGNRSLHAGFYANGIVRLVDSGGRCYQGTAENAVARMRELQGSSTFDLRMTQDDSEQMRGSFHGGPYDGLTISFEER